MAFLKQRSFRELQYISLTENEGVCKVRTELLEWKSGDKNLFGLTENASLLKITIKNGLIFYDSVNVKLPNLLIVQALSRLCLPLQICDDTLPFELDKNNVVLPVFENTMSLADPEVSQILKTFAKKAKDLLKFDEEVEASAQKVIQILKESMKYSGNSITI